MRRCLLIVVPFLLLSGIASAWAESEFLAQIQPLLREYCFECHNAEKAKGEVNLSRFRVEKDLESAPELWMQVLAQLKGRTMPPPKSPQPTPADFHALEQWLKETIEHLEDLTPQNPGKPVIHRLNRTEYSNTIRDLFGIELADPEDLPADDSSYGFDNIAEVLTMPPILLEKYLASAEKITDRILQPDPVEVLQKNLEIQSWRNARVTNGLVEIKLEDELGASIEIPIDEEYELQIRAKHLGPGEEPATLVLKIDGVDTHLWASSGKDELEFYSARIPLRKGTRRISLRHTSHLELPKGKSAPAIRFLIDMASISGPVYAVAREKLLQPQGGKVISTFAEKAFRRPLKSAEVQPYLDLYKRLLASGRSELQALRPPLIGILVSPNFLFRIENGQGKPDPQGALRLANHELASRLSYFLWSTMPDSELLTANLNNPAELKKQIMRMLGHPNSTAFVENFAGQWLGVRKLDTTTPDPGMFPTYKASLKSAMANEPLQFFRTVVEEDRPIYELISSDWTILNEELARHYGMKDVTGGWMRKVSLSPNSPRGGVMTMAAVLTITSHPTRTSPVKRGKWVLEEILGAPPPPPPPDVPELEKTPKGSKPVKTLREKLQRHREDPRCFGCHVRMDTLGLALENFDVLGRWREKEGDFKIDASGELPSGEKFNGPAELKKLFDGYKNEFTQAFTEKMLTYALGRKIEHFDRRQVKRIAGAVKANHYKFSTLVNEIVSSYPFQYRIPTQDKLP